MSGPPAAPVSAGEASPAAFVISLARRPDRRERFMRWNAGKGIDIAVFDAVDGQALNKRRLVEAQLIDDENLGYGNGHLGNALSHHALWEKCVALGRSILVFEDDAFLPETLPDFYPRIADELAAGCDILYLGYNRDAVLSVGFGGGDWCNIVFESPAAGFEYHAREHSRWTRRNAHAVLDTRLVWGIGAYAVSPAGAEALLRHCFPLSNKHPVRMFGTQRLLVPFSMDGAINVAVQRGLVKARVFFPPAVVGPNDLADSDTHRQPR
jgi:GR25 family glycosyltransferase involved in LPS biosynthesis